MIIEGIAGFIAASSWTFAVYHLGIRHGKKEVVKKGHVEYPGIPDDIDGPPTYDDFKSPRIFGVKIPEVEWWK